MTVHTLNKLQEEHRIIMNSVEKAIDILKQQNEDKNNKKKIALLAFLFSGDKKILNSNLLKNEHITSITFITDVHLNDECMSKFSKIDFLNKLVDSMRNDDLLKSLLPKSWNSTVSNQPGTDLKQKLENDKSEAISNLKKHIVARYVFEQLSVFSIQISTPIGIAAAVIAGFVPHVAIILACVVGACWVASGIFACLMIWQNKKVKVKEKEIEKVVTNINDQLSQLEENNQYYQAEKAQNYFLDKYEDLNNSEDIQNNSILISALNNKQVENFAMRDLNFISKKQNAMIGDIYRSISQVTNKIIPIIFWWAGFLVGTIANIVLLFTPMIIHSFIASLFKPALARKIECIFAISPVFKSEEEVVSDGAPTLGFGGLLSAITYGIGRMISETINVIFTAIALPFVLLTLWAKGSRVRKAVNKDPTVHDITNEFVEPNSCDKDDNKAIGNRKLSTYAELNEPLQNQNSQSVNDDIELSVYESSTKKFVEPEIPGQDIYIASDFLRKKKCSNDEIELEDFTPEKEDMIVENSL